MEDIYGSRQVLIAGRQVSLVKIFTHMFDEIKDAELSYDEKIARALGAAKGYLMNNQVGDEQRFEMLGPIEIYVRRNKAEEKDKTDDGRLYQFPDINEQ